MKVVERIQYIPLAWMLWIKVIFRDILFGRYYDFQGSNIMTLKSFQNSFRWLFVYYTISRLYYPSPDVKSLFLGKDRKMLMEGSIET